MSGLHRSSRHQPQHASVQHTQRHRAGGSQRTFSGPCTTPETLQCLRSSRTPPPPHSAELPAAGWPALVCPALACLTQRLNRSGSRLSLLTHTTGHTGTMVTQLTRLSATFSTTLPISSNGALTTTRRPAPTELSLTRTHSPLKYWGSRSGNRSDPAASPLILLSSHAGCSPPNHTRVEGRACHCGLNGRDAARHARSAGRRWCWRLAESKAWGR